MDFRDQVNRCLEHLRQQQHIPVHDLDESGAAAFSLAFQQTHIEVYLQLIVEGDIFSVFSPIGEIPKDRRPSFVEHLMAVNLVGFHTNGFAFALRPPDDQLFMTTSLFPSTCTPEALVEIVERLFVAVYMWKERLAQLAQV